VHLADAEAGRTSATIRNKNGLRLIGWKSIGQFLGCTERTARRWEADRALPVHRIPGGGRGSVWAYPDELSAWLQALPTDVQATLRAEASTDAQPPVGQRRLPWWLATALVMVVLAAGGAVLWRSGLLSHPAGPAVARTPYDDAPDARETYNMARFEVSERTAESLVAAERSFRQLVERYPERAAGWSGLADAYLLLREFGSMSDEVAYPQAARAARTALALDPRLASAWLDQAFVLWWWQGDSTVAFRDFETALQLDPGSARAYHWYATALYGHGDFQPALQTIERARMLAPDNRAIVADEAWIRFGSGQRAEGLATLEHLAQVDPQFVSWHSYLARAYLIEMREEDSLREARTAAELREQPEVVAGLRHAEQRFREGGRAAMLEQLAAEEAEHYAHGTGSAVIVAEYHALANDRPGMLRWLTLAAERHDHNLPGLRGCPEFAAYVDDPGYRQILAGLPRTNRMAGGK
jgi:tetratricopeptide (TPR) repeat protein